MKRLIFITILSFFFASSFGQCEKHQLANLQLDDLAPVGVAAVVCVPTNHGNKEKLSQNN